MPGEDFLLSDDGDLVDDGDGGFVMTTSAQPALRHQVLDALGAWVGDPTAGRKIRSLSGRNNSEADLQAEADSVRKALEVLQREGLIDDIRIETDRDNRGRWVLRIESRDTASGGVVGTDVLTEFGG